MYILQVWFNRHWKFGIRQYRDLGSANKRVEELKKVGIKSRIKKSNELYN